MSKFKVGAMVEVIGTTNSNLPSSFLNIKGELLKLNRNHCGSNIWKIRIFDKKELVYEIYEHDMKHYMNRNGANEVFLQRSE